MQGEVVFAKNTAIKCDNWNICLHLHSNGATKFFAVIISYHITKKIYLAIYLLALKDDRLEFFTVYLCGICILLASQ